MISAFAPIVTRVVPTIVWPSAAVIPTSAQLTPVFGDGTGTFKVWGATASNLTGSSVNVVVAAYPGAAPGWSALIGPNQTIVVPIPFIVSGGLAVTATTASAVSFTFFHSQII